MNAARSGKNVNAALKSAWGSTPVQLEAAEFLAKLDESMFWNLAEPAFWAGVPATDKGRHDAIVSFASENAGGFAASLLTLALATREQSPAVATHRQTAEITWASMGGAAMPCAWATVNGAVVESVEAMDAALRTCSKDSQNPVEDFDHVFPADMVAAAGAPVVVVFGMIGSEPLEAFHTAAKAKAAAGEVTYVLRHSDCGCSKDACSSSNKFNLQGYGVELAIKSIECGYTPGALFRGCLLMFYRCVTC